MKSRAEQLEFQRKEAEEQLKLKQAENELLRMACETNECLDAEQRRLKALAIEQYRQDLAKQIECNSELKVSRQSHYATFVVSWYNSLQTKLLYILLRLKIHLY